jgi:hypothetical protein
MNSPHRFGFLRRANWATLAFLVITLVSSVNLRGADSLAKKASFDIPAGPASETLKQFATQSGVQLIYAVDVADGVPTNSIKGTLSVRDAIDRLLAGTGLVVMERAGALAINRLGEPLPGDAAKNEQGRPASSRTARGEQGTLRLDTFEVMESKLLNMVHSPAPLAEPAKFFAEPFFRDDNSGKVGGVVYVDFPFFGTAPISPGHAPAPVSRVPEGVGIGAGDGFPLKRAFGAECFFTRPLRFLTRPFGIFTRPFYMGACSGH